ncbi:hypothetical protein [Halobacterium sp. CBA1126]|uniref:hypothetical protein n=1 Tax=Halobacterium sp. CBA1126 TaxID=2668074 RepID=UPI0012FAECE6|nr:hypothetical protein [Halobacterium sp. CBA1126]MUV60218.1 hypothetical protein [Halobacterium sp. CBA1126]
MGVARTFRALELYDILGNLIPGSTFLLMLAVIFEVEAYLTLPKATVTIGVFLIVAFVLGHVVQAVASKLEGKPTLFGKVIRASKGEMVEDVPIPITDVEEAIWPMLKHKFGLSDDFDNYGEMFRLLLSYIETTPATRALRFQALHSFHRSMWAVWYLVICSVVIAAVLKGGEVVAVQSWSVLGLTSIVALIGIQVFKWRKNKFNRLFIQYAVVDFYSDQIEEYKHLNRPAK